MKRSSRPKPQLDHARLHPVHCQAPGLFRPLKRGDRKNQKLDVHFEYKGRDYHFVGHEPLGADDLRVMLSAVALCGPERKRLPVIPNTDIGRQLRLFLDEKEQMMDDTVANKTTAYAIAREAGWSTKSSDKKKQIIKSFKRFAAVSVFETHQRWIGGPIKLMGFLIDQEDGRIWYALHPLGALVLFGEENIAKAYISLIEAREIKSDPALVLHQFLSSWIGPGHAQVIGIDAICAHIWAGPATGSRLTERRRTARKALGEITQLDAWRVEEIGPDKWRISRKRELPRLPEHVPS